MRHISEFVRLETVLEFRANRKPGKYTIDINSIKPGDKLLIKSDLSEFPVDKGFPLIGGFHIWKPMQKFLGKIVTVYRISTGIDMFGKRSVTIRIEETVEEWPIEIFELP